MKTKTCQILIACVYSRLGSELEASDLLNKEDWSPKKRQKDWSSIDAELVDMWKGVVRIVWNTPVGQMRAWADASNKAVLKLPEDEREANQLLLSVHLFDRWVNEHGCADFITKAAWKDRITRIKWEIIAKVNEAGGEELAAKTYTAADNLYRAIVGKPVLDSKIRKKHAEMVKRRLAS